MAKYLVVECVFSHYQHCAKWQKKTQTNFKYIPFACDYKFFNFSERHHYSCERHLKC